MVKKISIALFIILLLALTAFFVMRKSVADVPITPPATDDGVDSVPAVGAEAEIQKDDYIFSVRRSSDNNQFIVFVRTQEQYPCFNYQIAHEVEVSEQLITVVLGEVIESDVCQTALGPAQTEIGLNIVDGDYTLELRHGSDTDVYALDIFGSEVGIEPIDASFTSVE